MPHPEWVGDRREIAAARPGLWPDPRPRDDGVWDGGVRGVVPRLQVMVSKSPTLEGWATRTHCVRENGGTAMRDGVESNAIHTRVPPYDESSLPTASGGAPAVFAGQESNQVVHVFSSQCPVRGRTRQTRSLTAHSDLWPEDSRNRMIYAIFGYLGVGTANPYGQSHIASFSIWIRVLREHFR